MLFTGCFRPGQTHMLCASKVLNIDSVTVINKFPRSYMTTDELNLSPIKKCMISL